MQDASPAVVWVRAEARHCVYVRNVVIFYSEGDHLLRSASPPPPNYGCACTGKSAVKEGDSLANEVGSDRVGCDAQCSKRRVTHSKGHSMIPGAKFQAELELGGSYV